MNTRQLAVRHRSFFMASEISILGTPQERQTFTESYRHYSMSTTDLDRRRVDWDSKDVLFRSHIPENSWPYRAMVFDPRVFTVLYEKTARLLANKPQGRLVPREGGDALGAKINNELLGWQWDDNTRASGIPMLAKWATMDLNARKYGASWAYVPWRWQRQVMRQREANSQKDKIVGKSITYFDGPDFQPWNNRDVLHNPSYPTIRNWIQLRTYLTLRELEDINEVARAVPTYKNLDILRDLLMKSDSGGGDTRSQNYYMKNLSIKGLQDWLGTDPYNKVVEVVTEYTPERWITFAPKHGLVLRDVPNPYKHQQIPVIQLKYYPIDEDIYGLSEIEPVEKLQKAINALICQYLDAVNMSLYSPLKIRASAVQMHTLEFGPGKKWLMNDPATDVVMHDQKPAGINEFTSTYRFLVGAMQEALGETSAATSNLVPGAGGKTATEIRDLAQSKSARDNFNLMFLGEALKKQMMFWHKMNQQFLFAGNVDKQKVIEIVGKDAIKYFQNEGLDANGLDEQAIQTLINPDLAGSIQPEDLMTPLFPVMGKNGQTPKFKVDSGGQAGHLTIESEDLEGNYDFIPDVGSMSQMAPDQEIKAKGEALQMLTGVNPKTGQPTGLSAMIQAEGKKVKATELFVDYMEEIGFKDADQYIESIPQQAPSPAVPGGIGPQVPGGTDLGNVQNQGLGGGLQALAGGQAGPNVPQPTGLPF